MSYLLDANVFIEAKNSYNGLGICPGFWEWLLHMGNRDKLFSIDKVAYEIEAGQDELTDWIRSQGKSLFRKTQSTIATQFMAVSEWVTTQDYDAAAINTFFQTADYYLVAQALAGEHVLVTREVPSNSSRRIKIPNVCLGLEIEFMTPFQMLRIEGARFILEIEH
ncbi:MAG: DUF4411 family protein [Pyrinomonadaceae bacterium]